MRKPRPNTYNPAQVLHLINCDRSGVPLSCPSCSGSIERDPAQYPPAPMSHVTLRCPTGIVVEDFDKYQEGDILEFYHEERVEPGT